MPYLIQTPEEWFRTKQRDIYQLAYDAPEDLCNRSKRKQNYYRARHERDVKKLAWWLNKYLPGTGQTILGPSEYSGYILGGPRMRAVDFDAASRAKFEASWPENQPWRVVVHAYADWAQRIAAVRLLSLPHTLAEPCLWWDTPLGFILMSASGDGNLLSLYDAKWLLKRLCPDLPLADQDEYPRGEYFPPRPDKGWGEDCSCLIVGYNNYVEFGHRNEHRHSGDRWSGDNYIADRQRMAALRSALGLTSDHRVREIVDDF